MSETDSFIDEVSEEIRRDKLYASMRKYGWIAVVIVILTVGGAAFNEYRKARAETIAQNFGTSIVSALENTQQQARIDSLIQIEAPNPQAKAILAFLLAAEQIDDGRNADAVSTLEEIVSNPEVEEFYQDLAHFKLLSLPKANLSNQDRSTGLQTLTVAGNPLRLLAEEQLALLDLANGNKEAAIIRLRAIIQDAEVTNGLRQRSSQLMIALGVDPNDV